MSRILLTFIAFLYGASSFADATIILKDQDGTDDPYKSTTTMKVKDGTMLITDGSEKGSATLYRQAAQEIVQIDHESRTYIVMDEQAKNALSSQLGDQMAMIQEQLKGMPAEQREMLMKRMPQLAQMTKQDQQPTHTIKRTDRTDTVGGVKCTVVELHKEAKMTGGACVASAKELGISKGDYGTIKSMMDMMQSFAAQFGQSDMPNFEAVGGFPIKYSGSAGDAQSSELVSVDTGSLDASLFSVPEGYTRRNMGQ